MVVDTALTSPDDFRNPGKEVPVSSLDYTVGPRSVVVLLRGGPDGVETPRSSMSNRALPKTHMGARTHLGHEGRP